jgi:hypothetical protein
MNVIGHDHDRVHPAGQAMIAKNAVESDVAFCVGENSTIAMAEGDEVGLSGF